jgi:hypothetical protein
VENVIGIQKDNQDIDVEKRSSCRKASIRSIVTTPPRLGNGRNPNTETLSEHRPLPDISSNACRPGPEITVPIVFCVGEPTPWLSPGHPHP